MQYALLMYESEARFADGYPEGNWESTGLSVRSTPQTYEAGKRWSRVQQRKPYVSEMARR